MHLGPLANSLKLIANSFQKAGDRTRTDDNDVGNVVLYQLSYTRTAARRARGGGSGPLNHEL